MKKITKIILTTFLLSIFLGCSLDDQEVFEEKTELTEVFYEKMGNSTGDSDPVFEGCEVEYTFNDPFLSPAQKAFIRNSYGFVYSYTVVDHDTEIWHVNCPDYFDYNDLNPGCDSNGCYIETSGCPRGGCGSSKPKDPDPVEDPFGDSNN